MIELLRISGSLRAAVLTARASMRISVYAGLGDLPLFNPDLEAQRPDAVAQACMAVPLLGTSWSAAEIAADPTMRDSINDSLAVFAAALREFHVGR